MKALLKQWKITVSLLAIFLCGQGIGYAWASVQKRKECREAAAAKPQVADWKDRSLAKLKKELSLSESQIVQAGQVLDQTRERIEFEKERANFNAYLQVYRAHAELRPLLDPQQAAKLDKMKAELDAQIKRQFAKILDGPAVLDLAP